MRDEQRVWVVARKGKKKTTYNLRWLDPASGRWRSKAVGSDKRNALTDAVRLEDELNAGTYRGTRNVSWSDFAAEHVAIIPGKRNAAEARRTLCEFGITCKPSGPKRVTYAMVERYVAYLRTDTADHKANSLATINKKLRYLCAAFNKAIVRDYIARNPMEGWVRQREDKKKIRIASDTEEAALIEQAGIYGARLHGFIVMALNTGARLGELLALEWGQIDLADSRVTFVKTKGKRDRHVFLNPDVVTMLRRLQAQTIVEGGPFIGMGGSIGRHWRRIRKAAGVLDLTIHDLRRTYVTRLIRAGVPLPTVQRLAGHTDIKTTIEYYNQIDEDDLRAATVPCRSEGVG